MSTRLQIILISAIALMAAFGFAATALIMNGAFDPKGENSGSMKENINLPAMARAAALVPASQELLAIYPLVRNRYWALSKDVIGGEEERTWQTWSVDASSGKATLLKEIPAIPEFAFFSLQIEPSSSFRGPFVARLNSAWESPLHQQMEVIDPETESVFAFVQWIATGSAVVERKDESLDIAWHITEPCRPDATGSGFTHADGMTVNGTIIPFRNPQGATPRLHCGFNDFAGIMEYEGFGEPRFQDDVTGSSWITFELFPDYLMHVSLDDLRADAITFEYLGAPLEETTAEEERS